MTAAVAGSVSRTLHSPGISKSNSQMAIEAGSFCHHRSSTNAMNGNGRVWLTHCSLHNKRLWLGSFCSIKTNSSTSWLFKCNRTVTSRRHFGDPTHIPAGKTNITNCWCGHWCEHYMVPDGSMCHTIGPNAWHVSPVAMTHMVQLAYFLVQ